MDFCRCEIVFTSSGISGAEVNLCSLKNKFELKYVPVNLSGFFIPKINELNSSSIFAGGVNESVVKFFFGSTKRNCNILYAVGLKALIYCLLIKLINRKIKVIFALRWSPQHNVRDYVLMVVLRLFRMYVAYVIANSKHALKGIPRGLRCTYIHNGVSMSRFPLLKQNYEFAGKLCFVGTITKRKRIIDLVREMINAGLMDVYSLTVYGDGDQMDELKNLINQSSNPDKFILKGRSQSVGAELHIYDALLLPSVAGEGCPTVLLEARAAKLPTIYYEAEGIGEQQIPDITGIALDNYDIASMINILRDREGLEKSLLKIHQSLLDDNVGSFVNDFEYQHLSTIRDVH